MNNGNNVRGRGGPPPLPMYQPVVLKHVPTMVRRRYEHFDVDKLDTQDVATNEEESEDDGYMDISEEDELDDMGTGYNSSEQGSASEDGDDGDRLDVEHSACILDVSVKDEAQENGLENPNNDHGLRESEDTDLQNSNTSSEVDAGISVECQQSGEGNSTDDCDTGTYSESVGNGSIQPTDLQLECSESKYRGSNVVNHAPIVVFNLEDETQDKRPAEFSSERDLHSEYSGSEDDGSKVANHAPIVDSNLEDEIQDKRLTYLSNLHGFTVGDSIGEDNGAEDASTYPSVKDEALDMTEENSVNEQGLRSEDNKGECDEAEDENPTSCANVRVNSEAEEMGSGSSDDQQHTLTQMYDEDDGPENLIWNRSLHLTDLKSEGDGTKDMNDTIGKYTREATEVQEETHRYSSKEQEFNPEAFKKTVEEVGYELCCPYCKHCITNTLIYQRRENSQHCSITCFTSLITLFCCIRE